MRGVLSDRELHDALLFAAAVLIVLPLSPDRMLGPFNAINPRQLIGIVVLVMLVSALGYIALRLLGPRLGLPLAGFVSGFISSSAAIHAMGRRTREEPALMPGLVAGAVLSSVATILQMTFIVGLLSPTLLAALRGPLLMAGLAALGYAAWFIWLALREPASISGAREGAGVEQQRGRAFDLGAAAGFAALMAAVLTLAAALNAWMGQGGLLATAAISGLADAHAMAVAASALLAEPKIVLSAAVPAVLVALSTNALSKALLAANAGGAAYAKRVVPGLLLMVVAAWLGALL